MIGEVAVGEDFVTIYVAGKEVAHWVEDEWLEDPSITISIVNAVHLAHSNPELLVELLEEGK